MWYKIEEMTDEMVSKSNYIKPKRPHSRPMNQCIECGGTRICEHGQCDDKCNKCGGDSICKRRRQNHKCKECGGSRMLRTFKPEATVS